MSNVFTTHGCALIRFHIIFVFPCTLFEYFLLLFTMNTACIENQILNSPRIGKSRQMQFDIKTLIINKHFRFENAVAFYATLRTLKPFAVSIKFIFFRENWNYDFAPTLRNVQSEIPLCKLE